MRLKGKKVGKFLVVTVLAEYDLDVRLDMEHNLFTIHVPGTPGAVINTEHGKRDYESFTAPLLDEAKKKAREYLVARDTTDFVDVIEYSYEGAGDRHAHMGQTENFVGFDFRVFRVSKACYYSGRAKLEIPVVVDVAGNISVETDPFSGKERGPESHRFHTYAASIPYTVERWRKCCAIRDGISKLGDLLLDILGDGGASTADKLDAIGDNQLLLSSISRGRSP
jgi:hypothetical protein